FLVCAIGTGGTANGSYASIANENKLDGSGLPIPPSGLWGDASFDDSGFRGSVTLILSFDSFPLSGENMTEWDLNLDPAFNPANLMFSAPVKTGTFDDPIISLQSNQFAAGGAGNFDIRFAFSNVVGHRFEIGDEVKYTITGIPTLSARSFATRAPSGPVG